MGIMQSEDTGTDTMGKKHKRGDGDETKLWAEGSMQDKLGGGSMFLEPGGC